VGIAKTEDYTTIERHVKRTKRYSIVWSQLKWYILISDWSHYAASSDAGSYTCFASNSVGTGQSSTTQLSVIVQSKHCWNNYVWMKPKWEQRGFETRLVHL
jgi:hypothetical protein